MTNVILILLLSPIGLFAQSWGQLAVAGGLMAVSGYADGVAETVQFNYRGYKRVHPNTKEQWSNPQVSWRNKWKNGDHLQGPAFPFSNNLFVGVTDVYHLGNTVRNVPATTSMVVYAIPQIRRTDNHWWKQWSDKKPWWAYGSEFAFLTACRGLGFTAAYNWTYKGN
jgi:hypothetical protein